MKKNLHLIALVLVALTVLATNNGDGDDGDSGIDNELRDARGSLVELVSDVYGLRVLGRLRRQPGGLWAVVNGRARVLFYESDVIDITESDQDGIDLRIELGLLGARP